jgi:hypothetical protein
VGELVAVGAFLYAGGHDFTGDIKQWSVDGGSETKDKTTFRNSGARKKRTGLLTAAFSMNGFTDLSEDGQDAHLFTAYSGRSSRVITVGNDETEGQPCVMMQGLTAAFNPGGGGPVGELSAFSANGVSSDGTGAMRGALLLEQTAVSTTGAKGTGVQLGAVSATQYLYASLHLLGTAGTSITAVIESDDNSGFTTATTRCTFSSLTAADGYWATPAAGAITDDWYRLRVTSVTGSWTVACAAGVR